MRSDSTYNMGTLTIFVKIKLLIKHVKYKSVHEFEP